MKKKHIYTLALVSAVLLICSCVNEMDRRIDTLSGNKISFSTRVYNAVATKAQVRGDVKSSSEIFLGIMDSDSLFLSVVECRAEDLITKSGSEAPNKPAGFHITGFINKKAGTQIKYSSTPYITIPVTRNDSEDTYEPHLYWPVEYNHLNFFAYSPAQANLTADFINNTDDPKSVFSYKAPHSNNNDDAVMQPDLIYAISVGNTEENGNVVLEFSHILSGVKFNVPTTIGDASIMGAKIELGNIVTTGECTVAMSEDNKSISWIPDNTKKGIYSQTIDKGKTSFPDNGYFKLIPQDIESGNVTFTISLKTADDVEISFMGNLGNLEIKEWEVGKIYTYSITIREQVNVEANANYTNNNNTSEINSIDIVNTGFNTSYIRAAIVGYWYAMQTITVDGVEQEVEAIASVLNIDTDVTMDWETNEGEWDKHWEQGQDGFYYYKHPLEPGDKAFPLFQSYIPIRNTGPKIGESDSKLNVQIVVQARKAVKSGETYESNKIEYWEITQENIKGE